MLLGQLLVGFKSFASLEEKISEVWTTLFCGLPAIRCRLFLRRRQTNVTAENQDFSSAFCRPGQGLQRVRFLDLFAVKQAGCVCLNKAILPPGVVMICEHHHCRISPVRIVLGQAYRSSRTICSFSLLRLLAQRRRSALPLLHVCSPQRSSTGIGEGEEDASDWNHLQQGCCDSEAVMILSAKAHHRSVGRALTSCMRRDESRSPSHAESGSCLPLSQHAPF